MTLLPDIDDDPDITHALRSLADLMRARLKPHRADLAAMAVIWLASDDKGHSASCFLSHDPGPDALEHMADCLLGHDDFETTDLIIPRAS